MARLRWDDHAWLVLSFVILVAVVAFLSWDVDRRLDRNLSAVCAAAQAQASSAELDAICEEG